MESPETLGDLLKARRLALHKSQPAVAEMLFEKGVEVHSGSISRWETGVSTPESWTLEVLLDCFGVTGAERDLAVLLAHRSRVSRASSSDAA